MKTNSLSKRTVTKGKKWKGIFNINYICLNLWKSISPLKIDNKWSEKVVLEKDYKVF